MSSTKECMKCKTLDQGAFSKNNNILCKDCDKGCKVCAKTPDETEFYGHNKSTCKSCCIKRNKVNRLTFKVCPDMENFCRKIGKNWDELCKQKEEKEGKTKSDKPLSTSMDNNLHNDTTNNDYLSLYNKYEGLNSQFRELELDNDNLNDKLSTAYERINFLENKLKELISSHEGHLLYMNAVFKRNNLTIPTE